MKKFFIMIIYIIILNLTNCDSSGDGSGGSSTTGGNPGTITETFDDADMPDFEYNSTDNYYLCEPWNYDKSHNASRKYPLVVYLHGLGGAGEPTGLAHLGYGSGETAVSYKKTYPSFVYAAQTSGSWNNTLLISQIEGLKINYRIDANRIYLIGYSMGGSGSYSLANAYYDYNGHLFAGIIRLAGQSQTSVRDTIASSTSIWLHIGLCDTETRITVTRDAYSFLKTFQSSALESTSTVTIEDHPGTTLTLTKNSIEIVKKTEYDNDTHGVSNFPFKDENLISWLFKQTIAKR